MFARHNNFYELFMSGINIQKTLNITILLAGIMNLQLNRKTAMVWFIAFIMVGSTLGFVFLSGYSDLDENTVKYGEYTFTRTRDGVGTKIDGKDYWFRYFPKEVWGINISRDAGGKIKSTRAVYFTSNFSSANSQFIAAAEYDFDFAMQNLGIYTATGFVNENLTINAPYITCENATAFVPVVYFKDSNETEVIIENNCIILKAKSGDEFLMAKDRLVYSVLGITEES